MIEFDLPSLGADMDEGTLLEWKIHPGDKVHRGQVVAVIDTAKAAVEVECWHDGTVFELLIGVGAKVPVGAPIATLLEPGETLPSVRPIPTPAPVETLVTELMEGAMAPASRPRVSPAARKRAAELSINVDELKGSGPQGVVTLEDVEEAGRQAAPSDRNRAMRHAIAVAMSRSKREIPHYYLFETIPLGNAMAWLQAYNAQSKPQQRVLPSALLLKAVAVALRELPQLSGFWQNNAFQSATGIHLGVAITLRQGGLVAPALHDVADKPLTQVMSELASLVERARNGFLRSSELSDASVTVTQLGDQGVDSVLGVIYPPQVALIGFGRICERPWVRDGQLCAMPTVVASLAADHRASDGHYGARFLGEVRRVLQTPENL